MVLCAKVLLVKREFEQIFVHIDVILKKAKCLEDQMQAHEALISALFVSGSTSKSVGHARMVIEALGFPFPAYVEEETIFNIMNTLGKQSEGFTQDHVSLFPLMDDPVTLQAMRIMSIVMFPCSLVDPTMFLLMACQMMQLTIAHGLCADSALGGFYFYSTFVIQRFVLL